MKLAAIFICWNDWDLLEHSVKNIRPLVDGVIIIGSETSNYSYHSPIPDQWRNEELHICEPALRLKPAENETRKRNFGLEIARKSGYTHFICLDADEFYKPDEFLVEKEKFKFNPSLHGMVCRIQTYFKSPTLTIGDEGTLVPFIHKITPGLKHEFNRRYPFAWQGNRLKIDPTRSLNIFSGVEMSDTVMHHMSWVRKNYVIKVRSSTARANLEKSTIFKDLDIAKAGEYCQFYEKYLERVPNYFNIPDYGVENENS